MRYFTLILFLFIAPYLWAQQDTTVIVKDFNSDKHPDTLVNYYIEGEDFGGMFCSITDGENGATYFVNTYANFNEMTHIYYYSKELIESGEKKFMKAIDEVLLPEKRKKPDSSLKWILSSYDNIHYLKNSNFDRIICPQTKWEKTPIVLPDQYYCKLKKPILLNILDVSEVEIQENYRDVLYGGIIYNSHVHTMYGEPELMRLAHANSDFEIFTTNHGIIVEKKGKYKWIFISEQNLTGTPNKINFPSIGAVQVYNDCLIFSQMLEIHGTRMYVIDLQTNRCGRITKDNLPPEYNDLSTDHGFHIEGNTLIIGNPVYSTELNLDFLIDELRGFDK